MDMISLRLCLNNQRYKISTLYGVKVLYTWEPERL